MTKLHDVEPIYMDLGKDSWVHPGINSICKFKKNRMGDALAQNVSRLVLFNKNNEILFIVFLSKELNTYWRKRKPIDQVFIQKLYAHLEVMLLEDVWSPGGEQFCFSSFGQNVFKFLDEPRQNPEIIFDGLTYFINGDVGLAKHSDGTIECIGS